MLPYIRSVSQALPSILLAIATLGAASTDAYAAPPEAFLEHAQIYGFDKTIRVERVPTKDMAGKTQYFDLVINLKVDANGKVKKKAKISSKKSPTFLTNELIAGDYDDTSNGICRLTLGRGNSGRQTGAFICVDRFGTTRYQANIATGPIDGHPYEQKLKGAGIDQLPAVKDFIWGIASTVSASLYLGCFQGATHVVGVNQVSNILTITLFGNDAIEDCSRNFVLKVP